VELPCAKQGGVLRNRSTALAQGDRGAGLRAVRPGPGGRDPGDFGEDRLRRGGAGGERRVACTARSPCMWRVCEL
jgi:hypothetical protein